MSKDVEFASKIKEFLEDAEGLEVTGIDTFGYNGLVDVRVGRRRVRQRADVTIYVFVLGPRELGRSIRIDAVGRTIYQGGCGASHPEYLRSVRNCYHLGE